MGTFSSELTLGTHVQIPGVLTQDIDLNNQPSIGDILTKPQFKNNRAAVLTSSNPQTEVGPPSNVSHVYTRQHDVKGLQPKYRGPFKVISRPTRSTLEIKVGVCADGSDRTEVRAWKDCKPAYLRENITEASRPRRGRPRKTSPSGLMPSNTPDLASSSSDTSQTVVADDNNNKVASVNISPSLQHWVAVQDFSGPPLAGNLNSKSTHADQAKMWSATLAEIAVINASIRRPQPGNSTLATAG